VSDPATGRYPQRLEAKRIAASAGVVAGTLDLVIVEDGELLTFGIASEPTVNPPVADVRDVEPIVLVYKDGRRFGETAPSHVLCAREDFPRSIVHLCSGRPGGLAAPCLALGGLQPLYERAGIEAVLERLRKFLRDAKTGTLTADGWEPVPFGIDQVPCGGEVVPRFFQDHAHANLAAGSATGVAINMERDEGRFVAVFPQIVPVGTMAEGIAFRNRNAGGKRVGIPWAFLWPTTVTPESDPVFGDWRDGAELLDGMKRIGVDRAFDSVVGQLLAAQVDFHCHREPAGGKGMVVILGVWRPEPIMREFFGYSDDPEARRLELRAFRVSQDLGKEIVGPDARVETIVGDYPGSPELYRWVAGVNAIPPLALVGGGAIGSAVFDHLARSGLDDAVVIDQDRLRPHNLARHTADSDDLYHLKADAASRRLHALVRDMSLKFEAINADVTEMEEDALAATVRGRLVVDATADERVRLRMDRLRAATDVTVVRTEMLHEGRLGVTFVAPPDGPSLADMTRMLFATAADDPAVAAWLEHEHLHPLGPDPLLAGFGCTSQTIHLPVHAVQQHASVATATILGDRSGAGVALNPTDGRYRPTGWRWLPVEPFATLVPPTEKDWQVRISRPALDRMTSERVAALPAETGGYLYGAWDPSARAIIVTTASTLPPGSTASATSLELGPAGGTAEERRLALKARGRIHLVGTWHSHPNSSARMSGRDHATMTAHQARDAETLSPTLLVIVADGDVQAHLRLP
jgi:proteasome lid subunit RPN8/RPN11